jgi:hypothetical protein
MLFANAAFAGGQQLNQYAAVPGATCTVAGKGVNNPGAPYFAAKSIGARNESTTASIWVICPFALTPTPAEGGVIKDISLYASTLDGGHRYMTCTAVIGSIDGSTGPTYSAKSNTISPYTVVPTAPFYWTPVDFNGASPSGGMIGSAWATVTCLLPPQTSIDLLFAKLNPTIQ